MGEVSRRARLETAPHYTDQRFARGPLTVFGKEDRTGMGHKGLSYDYSDRLQEWDYKKYEAACLAANESGAPARSADWYETMISAYRGKPCRVEHIMAGVNLGNGYPYYVLGYRVLDGAEVSP